MGLNPLGPFRARVGSNPTPGTTTPTERRRQITKPEMKKVVRPGPVGGGGERNRARAPR